MSRGRMRVLAIVLAVLAALGAVYAGVAFGLWAGMVATVGRSAKDGVRPGFVGVATFGHWRLICVPGPGPGLAAATGAAPDSPAPNACRLNQEVSAEERPNRVIVAANLSLVGPMKKPALMLRLPGTFHAGDAISLDLGAATTLAATVRDCTPDECVAANALSDSEWNHLIAAKTIEVAFPMAGGQSAFINLPVDGLTEAAAALDVAESAAPQ